MKTEELSRVEIEDIKKAVDELQMRWYERLAKVGIDCEPSSLKVSETALPSPKQLAHF